MSNQKSINQFFSGKFFEIPKYQRSYAWEKQNIRELFEDINEALETNSNHYIGTVVLAKTENPKIFNIVDGQQRITTLVMFINAIANELSDQSDCEFTRRFYVKDKTQFKLSPLERDKLFYFQILDSNVTSEPKNKSQRYMLEAYNEITNIVKNHINDLDKFSIAIRNLSSLLM